MIKPKKHTFFVALRLFLAVFGGIALFLVTCADFHVNDGFGECISIAFFEKYSAGTVDKIVIKAEGKEITITDTSLIQEIVRETTIATHANIGHAEYRQIYAYSRDQLIRSMVWGGCCDEVKVYEEDGSHWLFTPDDLLAGNGKDAGYVYLSKALVNKLNTIIAANES